MFYYLYLEVIWLSMLIMQTYSLRKDIFTITFDGI